MANNNRYNPTKRNKQLLSQVNKRIRAKQRRLKKNYGVEVPDQEVGIKHLKDFNSNKQIRDYLKEQDNSKFLNRNLYRYVKNKHGVVLSMEEKKEFQKNIDKINKENKKQMRKLEKTPMKHNGKELGYSAGENARLMGDSRINMFRPRSKSIDRFRTRGEFKKAKQSVNSRANQNLLELNQTYRRNYITAMEKQLNGNANHIIELIMSMPLDQMVSISLSTTDADIDFVYSLEETMAKVKVLESVWGYDGDDSVAVEL